MRQILPRWTAALCLLAGACDDGAAPEIELREGQTATFKTANTDTSFKWKGCEPPWGPDPYREATPPTESWLRSVDQRIAPDLGANVLDAWREAGGGEACDVGCARLDLGWTGEARPVETRSGVRDVRPIGRCDDRSLAWSVDVAVSTSFECTCG